MSMLIDKIINENTYPNEPLYVSMGVDRYLAKPCNPFSLISLKNRIKDAWRVILGKSFACHYYEDRPFKSNFEHIKEMNIDEMTYFIAHQDCSNICSLAQRGDECLDTDSPCLEGVREWLQSPMSQI